MIFVLFLAHIQSKNNSEYYCDDLHKSLNSNYATTSCLQHGVISADGQLIPFTYSTNAKSPKISCRGLTHNSITNENNTIHLSTNPMNHLDYERTSENFYHTLTPLNVPNQYDECPIGK